MVLWFICIFPFIYGHLNLWPWQVSYIFFLAFRNWFFETLILLFAHQTTPSRIWLVLWSTTDFQVHIYLYMKWPLRCIASLAAVLNNSFCSTLIKEVFEAFSNIVVVLFSIFLFLTSTQPSFTLAFFVLLFSCCSSSSENSWKTLANGDLVGILI